MSGFPSPDERQRRLEALRETLHDEVFEGDIEATMICQRHVDRPQFSLTKCVAELCWNLARRRREAQAEAGRLRSELAFPSQEPVRSTGAIRDVRADARQARWDRLVELLGPEQVRSDPTTNTVCWFWVMRDDFSEALCLADLAIQQTRAAQTANKLLVEKAHTTLAPVVRVAKVAAELHLRRHEAVAEPKPEAPTATG